MFVFLIFFVLFFFFFCRKIKQNENGKKTQNEFIGTFNLNCRVLFFYNATRNTILKKLQQMIIPAKSGFSREYPRGVKFETILNKKL